MDGGRFFEAVLFSRHPILEVVFKTLTTLALGWVAWLLKAPVLGFFSVMIFFSLKTTYSFAKIAHEYKKKNRDIDNSRSLDIPDDCIEILVPVIKQTISGTVPNPTPKVLATHIQGVWQRVQNRPSKLSASLGMVVAYLAFLVVGVLSFFLFIGISYAIGTTQTVTKTLDNGSQQRYEQRIVGTNIVQEFELNDQGWFHGTQTDWSIYTEKVEKTGQWVNGYRHGTFLFYDQKGNNNRVLVYEKGIPISYQILENGEFIEVPESDWEAYSAEIKRQDEPIKADSASK